MIMNKNKKRVELLAPAGNADALFAAVENGADAVYLGGKQFNARRQAGNFDTDSLKEALEYAHTRDVNIYLALNTLVADNEIKQALNFASEACMAGIDGIIVQDLGLAVMLRRLLPEIPLHASTQMTIYDLDGVKVLEEMGFTRVVLARELTLDEISYIARNTKLEVEIFIHGALCVCYSGQCLMSSIIGGRSGNRGNCAQPCRLPYELAGGAGKTGRRNAGKARYIMSPKDICTVEYLYEIAASGVSSLKIEGRLKSPEYVAVVVRTYRKYLDMALEQMQKAGDGKQNGSVAGGSGQAISDRDMHDLLQIFNRGGFSHGYLKGKAESDIICPEKPNNSGVFLGRTVSYDGRTKSVGILLQEDLSIGDGIEIWTGKSENAGGIVTSIRESGKQVKLAGSGKLVFAGDFKGWIAPEQKVFKTLDAGLNKSARESFSGKNRRRAGIKGYAALRAGNPLTLRVEDADGNMAEATGTVLPEMAINRPLDVKRLKEQLDKTGPTPFRFEELRIELDENLSLPIGEINEVRRKALEELYRRKLDKHVRRYGNAPKEIMIVNLPGSHVCGLSDGKIECLQGGKYGSVAGDGVEGRIRSNSGSAPGNSRIALYFYKYDEGIDYSGLGADRYYFPVAVLGKPDFGETAKKLADSGAQVFVWFHTITRGNYSKIIDSFLENHIDRVDGILAGNIGTFRKLEQAGIGSSNFNKGACIKLAGDISLNIYNSCSAAEMKKKGLDSIALSMEMTLRQIKELSKPASMSLEAVVYGRLPLMASEYCPVGGVGGGFGTPDKCGGCSIKNEYRLKDRTGAEFPVICDKVDCRSVILNSSVLFIPDDLRSLKSAGIDIFRLYIWNEEETQIKELVGLHRAALSDKTNYAAEYGRLIASVKEAGFTKGHYHRGV